MTIGERIKKRREELGLSQQELADKLGYTSRSTINKIEKDANNLRQTKIVDFARVLKTSPGYLMGWEDYVAEDTTTEDNILIEKMQRLSADDRQIIEAMIERMIKKE